MNAVGWCPTCGGSVLTEVWTLFVGVRTGFWWTYLGDWYNTRIPTLSEAFVYADCPVCGGDVDQWEMTS